MRLATIDMSITVYMNTSHKELSRGPGPTQKLSPFYMAAATATAASFITDNHRRVPKLRSLAF